MRNDKGNPPGKLAEAELHFSSGPLEGLKLIGFAVWERKTGNGRNVTFPARQSSVNGERRSFALLRPQGTRRPGPPARHDSARLRRTRIRRSSGRIVISSNNGRGGVALIDDRYELEVFFQSLRWQGPLFAQGLVGLGLKERGLHAAVDDVPGEDLVFRPVAKDVEIGVNARLGDCGAPLAAIALRCLDGVRDATIAQREQRLVIGMSSPT